MPGYRLPFIPRLLSAMSHRGQNLDHKDADRPCRQDQDLDQADYDNQNGPRARSKLSHPPTTEGNGVNNTKPHIEFLPDQSEPAAYPHK